MSEHSSKNLDYVPSNATFAIRIDGRELAENTLFSIILESKDEDILKLFEESIKQRTSGEKEITNTGINFLSDVVIFKVPYHGEEVNGILFNLLNRTTFLKNMPDLIGKGKVVAAKDNIGIVLTLPAQKSSIKIKSFQNFAESIIKSKNKGHHKIFHSGSAPNRFSEIHFHSVKNSNDEAEVNLVFEQKEQAFKLSGNLISVNKTKVNDLSHILKQDGLHITSRLFSETFADSLRNVLSFLSKKIPAISAFSINYRGVNVINHSSGFLAIPDAELIIQCEEDFNVSDFFHDPEMIGNMDCELTDNYIRFDTETLYFKQLTPKSFYIGKDPSPALIENQEQNLMTIQGDLSPLTNIKGGGMMTAFLEMVPIFKASKNLAKSSEKIDFSISRISDNKAKIDGSLIFKEGHYPLSEIMRFLLSGNIVK